MIGAADVVVIGAGALGASAAFHLARPRPPRRPGRPARAGLADLAARGWPGRPAARHRHDEPAGDESAEMILRFEAETGQPLEAHRSGSLKAAPAGAGGRARRGDRARPPLGLALDTLSPDQAAPLAFLGRRGALRAPLFRPTPSSSRPAPDRLRPRGRRARRERPGRDGRDRPGQPRRRIERVETDGGRSRRRSSSTRPARGRGCRRGPGRPRLPRSRPATSCSSPSRSPA